MNLFQELEARGIVKQVTDPSLAQALEQAPLTLYCGFDPTADSLHIGSLLPLVTLRRFQLAGHRVIALVGGATGMIGDPSGKGQERQLLDDAQLELNVRGISKIIHRILDFETSNLTPVLATEAPDLSLMLTKPRVVNNADWFRNLSFIGFLRDVGKHFTVNHMMAKESVRARLEDREHGISYTEFSYMLLQALDFHHLHEKEGCALQIGGSDQWGNITAGIDLIRRMRFQKLGREEEGTGGVFGMTHPLVSKADGTKFGKTEVGTVWLDSARTSPYQLYQFLIQTADADVVTFLKYFTFLPLGKIAELAEAARREPEKREAQKTLASEVTSLVHGAAELARAEKASQALFGEGIRELDERTLLDVLEGAPSTKKERQALEGAGFPLIDALVESGLSQSKGQARKDLTSGGVYVNNERIIDPAKPLLAADLIAGAHIVLRKGKRTYHLLSFD